MSKTISESMLPEFDHEMANTRRMLERVPDMQGAFTPHPKSMTLARLAGHVAQLPMWGITTLGHDEFDLRPDGPAAFTPYQFTSTAEALKYFDENVRQLRALLVNASDETMARPWSLKNQGQVIFTMPKTAVMRSFVMNHLIHHRGQLGIYLRMNNVPIPGMYGPSADEQ